MASKVFINEETQAEIKDALLYYEKISPELSDDLLVKFRAAVYEISNHPKLYQPIRGKYRKINLERFPYKIIFRIKSNELHIVAFAHHKRKPSYWKKR